MAASPLSAILIKDDFKLGKQMNNSHEGIFLLMTVF